jgi:cruciform cutting endonuclease 1
MAPKQPTLTAKALQALLMRIGSASSGTKNLLFGRFKQDMARPSPLHRLTQPNEKSKETPDQQYLRVMSIDMGIKNLAYCVSNLRCSSGSNVSNQSSAAVNISAWKKIDLIERTREYRAHSSSFGVAEEETNTDEELDPYSLAVLSHTAYRLVTQEVLSHKPDIILIEKQRWRSGGGSAIQQWTIRVNTLEAMLWAILETLKHSAHTFDAHGKSADTVDAHGKVANTNPGYEVFAVDPKRVGHYWLAQHARVAAEKTGSETADMPLVSGDSTGEEEPPAQGKKLNRSKAEKKAKIGLLRSWLTLNPASSAPSTPSCYPAITFTFDTDTESARQAICTPSTQAGRKKSSKRAILKETQKKQDMVTELEVDAIGDTELKKLDDVTDCFLQAAAWMSWELNRLQLLNEHSKGGKEPLDEVAVLKMLDGSR